MEFSLLADGVKRAVNAYFHNIVAYIVAIVLFAIIVGILGAVGLVGGLAAIIAAIENFTFETPLLIALAAAIIGFLILSPLMYSLYYMAIKGSRGEDVKIGDLFYAFKSGKVFIRSLVYVIVYAIVIAVVAIIVGVLAGLIGGAVSLASVSAGALIATVLSFILMLLVEIFFFFTIYIYIMTPGKGFFYALKESIRVGSSNIIMTLLTIIISWILSILIITIPLGYLFGSYMLKELYPTLKDESGL